MNGQLTHELTVALVAFTRVEPDQQHSQCSSLDGREAHEPSPLAERVLTVGDSGEGESVFFKSVAPDRLTMLSGWPYTRENMDSTKWTQLFLNRDMKLGGEVDLGVTGEQWGLIRSEYIVSHSQRIKENV